PTGIARLAKRSIQSRVQLTTMLTGRSSAGRLLLSDENILQGSPLEDLVQEAPLYRHAAARCLQVRLILRLKINRVLICIRSYDEFFSSYYVESLRWGNAILPDTFRKNCLALDGGWPSLLHRLRRVFWPAELIVWDFDAFVRQPMDVACIAAGL